jgi:hypothetical protein
MTRAAALALRVLGTLVLATISWALLGYFATMPLGAIYGWGGHPALPSAPIGVYIALYGVVFPLLCLAAAWVVMGRLIRPGPAGAPAPRAGNSGSTSHD